MWLDKQTKELTANGLQVITAAECEPRMPKTWLLTINIQSTLVISNSKELSETLRDICTSTYQIFRIEEKIIRTTSFLSTIFRFISKSAPLICMQVTRRFTRMVMTLKKICKENSVTQKHGER